MLEIPKAVRQPSPAVYGRQHGVLWVPVLVLVACVGLLAACGSPLPDAAPSPSGPTPTVTVPIELPVVLTLLGTFRDEELTILDEQIARFEAGNPGILVQIASVSGGSGSRRQVIARILAEVSGDVDVLMLNGAWLSEYASEGWLIPLDGYAQSQDVDLTEFLPGALQACTIDGRLLALPRVADGGLLYYRKDLLSLYGSTPPETWADLHQAALQIKDTAGLSAGYVWQGAAYETLTCNTLEFVWSYGGDVLNSAGDVVFDSPETVRALEEMASLVRSGASPPDTASYRESAALTAFHDGDAAFMRNWPYAWDAIQEEQSPVSGQVGVAPLPTSCLFGEMLAISAQSLYPDQAFRLIEFLVEYDQQTQLAIELGRPPSRIPVYSDAGLLANRPIFRSIGTALADVRPLPQSVSFAAVSEAIYDEVNQMLAGEQEPSETAARIQTRIEAILAR